MIPVIEISIFMIPVIEISIFLIPVIEISIFLIPVIEISIFLIPLIERSICLITMIIKHVHAFISRVIILHLTLYIITQFDIHTQSCYYIIRRFLQCTTYLCSRDVQTIKKLLHLSQPWSYILCSQTLSRVGNITYL